MSTPALRPKILLDTSHAPPAEPGGADALRRALALTTLRELQGASLVPTSATLDQPVPGKSTTYEAALLGTIGDANGNGRPDLDVEALRGSGVLTRPSSNSRLEALLGGSKAPLTDQFIRDKDPGSVAVTGLPFFMASCGPPPLTERGKAAQRAGAGLSLTSDLDARVAKSPEEARKVAREAVAGAQFFDASKDPAAARELLVRSGEALYARDRLQDAQSVFRELAREPRAAAKLDPRPAGVSDETCGALADRRLADIHQRLTHLSPEELDKFGPRGSAFLGSTTQWIDDEIARNRETIARKGDEPGACKPNYDRIALLERQQQALVEAARAGQSHGEGLLTVGNVVLNEAGTSGPAAKDAIAYAWLNRTEGHVREPVGNEVSHYKALQARWDDQGLSGRLTILDQLPDSLRAANVRLSDPDPAAHDPVAGADHWVSPQGLAGRPSGTDTYRRDYDGLRDVPFPSWARDPVGDAASVARLRETGSLYDDYREFTATGVPGREFLFYTGVNKGLNTPEGRGQPGL
jgi:hypothetical protein